jgi:hypothetical protein
MIDLSFFKAINEKSPKTLFEIRKTLLIRGFSLPIAALAFFVFLSTYLNMNSKFFVISACFVMVSSFLFFIEESVIAIVNSYRRPLLIDVKTLNRIVDNNTNCFSAKYIQALKPQQRDLSSFEIKALIIKENFIGNIKIREKEREEKESELKKELSKLRK